MKTISIGSSPTCQIQIKDERIGRQHAVLRIYSLGKMEIIDQNSINGTYVNGVKVTPDVPFPVKRKDTITFAKTGRQLDWHDIPNPVGKLAIYGICSLFIVALIYAIALMWNNNSEETGSFGGGGSSGGSVYQPQGPDFRDSGESIEGGSIDNGGFSGGSIEENKSKESSKDSKSTGNLREDYKRQYEQDKAAAAQAKRKADAEKAKKNNSKGPKEPDKSSNEESMKNLQY